MSEDQVIATLILMGCQAIILATQAILIGKLSTRVDGIEKRIGAPLLRGQP